MTSTDVLSMYEQMAGLSNQMVDAARTSNWDSLGELEQQCAVHASRFATEAVPALSGAPRLRKIDLLKQIMANDREVRTITEPWMAQLNKTMRGGASA